MIKEAVTPRVSGEKVPSEVLLTPEKPEEEPKPKPYIVSAQIILSRHNIQTNQETGQIYLYHKGVWKTSPAITRHIKALLIKQMGNSYTGGFARDGMDYIKAVTAGPPLINNGYLCATNGSIDINSFKIIEHEPKLNLTNKIPVVYNPAVSYDEWDTFVLGLTGGKEEYCKTLQEYLGYTLIEGQTAKKLLYLHGTSDSGKSTYLDIIQNFLGKYNVSHSSIFQLCERFGLLEIRERLANIHADLDYSRSHKHIALLKSITGDDNVSAEIKGKQDLIKFMPSAKLYFSGNGIPNVPSTALEDDAFLNRWLPIEFPNHYPKTKGIREQWYTEEAKTAILNWAIDGLKRLRDNGYLFSFRPDKLWLKDWFTGGLVLNNAERYIMINYRQSLDDYETKDSVYEGYLEYCKKLGLYPLDKHVFAKCVSNHKLIEIERYRPVINGEQVECWKGIKKVELKEGIGGL